MCKMNGGGRIGLLVLFLCLMLQSPDACPQQTNRNLFTQCLSTLVLASSALLISGDSSQSLKGSSLSSDQVYLENYQGEDWDGWTIAGTVPDRFNGIEVFDSIGSAPEGFVRYSSNPNKGIRPITGDPSSYLKKGDILVAFTPESGIQGNHLEYWQQGHWHIAIVAEDEKGLLKIQPPSTAVSRDFDQGLYHIYRANPARDNERLVDRVNQFILRAITEASITSEPESLFEVLSPNLGPGLEEQLLSGEICWRASCAEVALTPYILYGHEIPSQSESQRIDALAKLYIDERVSSEPGLSRREAAEDMIRKVYANGSGWKSRLNSALEKFAAGEPASADAEKFLSLLTLAPSQRLRELRAFDYRAEFRDGEDIVRSSFSDEPAFQYVATYTGEPYNIDEEAQTFEINPVKLYTIGNYRDFSFHELNEASLLIHATKGAYNVHLSSNERYLVSSGGDSKIFIYDRRTHQRTFIDAGMGIRTDVHPSESIAIVGGFGGFVRVLDLETQEVLHSFSHEGDLWALNFNSSGSHFYSAGNDGVFRQTNLSDYSFSEIYKSENPIKDFEVDEERGFAYLSTANAEVVKVNIQTGEHLTIFKSSQHSQMVLDVNRQKLIAGEESLFVKDLESGQLKEIPLASRLTKIHLNPTSGDVYFSTSDGSVFELKSESSTPTLLTKFDEYTNSFDISPDGQWILIGSEDWNSRLIHIPTRSVETIEHLSPILNVRLTNRFFMTADGSGGVHLFRLPKVDGEGADHAQ